MTTKITSSEVIYRFSPDNKPVKKVNLGETVVFETIDAFGGQITSEEVVLDSLDWNHVNPATGPLYVEGANPGDTLIVEILKIKIDKIASTMVAPGFGALAKERMTSKVKLFEVHNNVLNFNNLKIKLKPMIGVIGVAPKSGEFPTGTSGNHGGNMDVSEINQGTKIYFPVFCEGALLALGDLHAVQADGELSIAAAEVSGEVSLRVNLIKGAQPEYPILEKAHSYSIITYGDTLEEAVERASKSAVIALMKEHNLSFEEALMMGSLIVDLKINQVVDPKKGVRAEILKDYISLQSMLL